MLNHFEERVNPQVGYRVIETPSEIILLDSLEPQPGSMGDGVCQKVLIVDDYVCENNQNEIINYFIKGRHSNYSVIYLSQTYFKVPKNIRDNCSHFCIFRFFPERIEGSLMSWESTQIGWIERPPNPIRSRTMINRGNTLQRISMKPLGVAPRRAPRL